MSSLTAAKARQNFSETISQVAYGKERIVLTRRGKKLVAVIPIEDLNVLEALENKQDLGDAKKALQEAKRSGTVPWESVRSKKGRKR